MEGTPQSDRTGGGPADFGARLDAPEVEVEDELDHSAPPRPIRFAAAPDAPRATAPGGPGLPAIFDQRSPYLSTCPFFRSEDDFGTIAAPIEEPDPANRCVALGQPKPQSARQQELVCLTGRHVDCPRYLQGAIALREGRPHRRVGTASRATVVALALLALSAAASFAFVLARGGLALPVGMVGTQVAAAATATPAPTSLEPPTPAPTATPAPTPAPTAAPTPSPTPTPIPTSSPTPVPTPRPTTRPTPTPRPVSDRYRLLDPCPNTPNCWIYTVRSGDNLYSIAHYFGVSLDTVYRLNPWTRTTRLRAGQQLILPPPTR